MRTGTDVWSREEVEAIVADYLSMLICELKGENYNKAEHNRGLQKIIGRSKGSIEMKHMNISAVLGELGYPCIDGYKPARNYQRSLLPEIVEIQVNENVELQMLLQGIFKPAEIAIPTIDQILSSLVDPPRTDERVPAKVRETLADYKPRKVDYLARDASNTKLGLAGEMFILRYEKARLIAAGKESLADNIQHTSQELGDGLGFDIQSFEVSGQERLIEVKTTKFSRHTPFFVTPKELYTSQQCEKTYYLYRVFQFTRLPKFFAVGGCLDKLFSLKPTQYLAF